MVKLTTLCQVYLQENFWLAQSTQETTERAFRWLAQCIGNCLVADLTADRLEHYKGWLLKTSRQKTTANIYLRAIKTVVAWAVLTKKIIEQNPVENVKELRVTRNPVRNYDDYQVERMLRFAPNIQWQGIILVGFTTGLRRGEILNLTWENIRQGFIYVEPKRNTKYTWEWEPKDKEIRRVPLVEPVGQMFSHFNRELPYLFIPPKVYCRLITLKDAGLLDQTRRNCPLQNFRRTLVTIHRKAFGRQIGNFKMLRSTYTTMMCDLLPEHFTIKLLGHSSTKTLTYYQAARESYYEIARQIASKGIKMGPLACNHSNKSGALMRGPDWAIQDSNL